MNTEIKRAEKIVTKEEFITFIENECHGILFGSRALGVETSISDYDYLVLIDDYKRTVIFCKENNIRMTDSLYYLQSYYVSLPPVNDFGMLNTINIVTCRGEDIDAWKTTIAMMKQAPKEKIKDAKNRKLLFECLLSILKQF